MTLREAIIEVLRKKTWAYTYVIRNTISMSLSHIAWEVPPFPKATSRQVRDELVKIVPSPSPAYVAWALIDKPENAAAAV